MTRQTNVHNFTPQSTKASFTPIGYDVWMINIRGNSYSKNHQWLDVCPTCSEFWAFGFDESARYDYPATIGKIF